MAPRPFDGGAHPWLVLRELWDLMPGIQGEVAQARGQARAAVSTAVGKKLRETDPW